MMTENELTYQIRGAIFEVYNNLGPGLLEKVYEEVLAYELHKRNLKVERQKKIPLCYDGKKLQGNLRLDILVEDRVIIELKSVENMTNLYHLQLLTYLKLTSLHRGILVNFNTDNILKSIWTKVNGCLPQ
jgi:hypothetical protein